MMTVQLERAIWFCVPAIFLVALLGACSSTKGLKLEDETARQKIKDGARQALVRINIEFQKDPAEGEPKDNRIGTYISNKTTWDTTGLALGSDGTILMDDNIIEPKYFKTIKVTDANGNEYEAELKGLCRDAPVLMLNIKGDKKPAGPDFAPAGEMKPERKLYLATLFKDNENWFYEITPLSLSPHYPYAVSPDLKPWYHIGMDDRARYAYEAFYNYAVVLYDENANLIGYMAETRIQADGKKYGWNGQDLVTKDAIISCADFDKKKEDVRKTFFNYVPEVKFKFRQKEKDSSDPFSSVRSYVRYSSDDEQDDPNAAEKKLYGLVINKSHILIPEMLSQDLIFRTEGIDVTIGDKTVAAEFLGAYKNFNAMLIKLEDGIITDIPDFYTGTFYDDAGSAHGRAVYTLKVKEKFNKRDDKVHYDRFMRVVKGYKDKIKCEPTYTGDNGTIFITPDMKILGVLMAEQKDLAEELASSRGRYYSYGGRDYMDRVYFYNDLKEPLVNPTAYFNPNMVPLSDREMKRVVALGVEFQKLTKELAEQLDCAKITRDGTVGLLVTHIYADSPAQKAGIQVNDIFLKIQEEGKDEPIELKDSSSRYDYSYLTEFFDRPEFEEYAGRLGGMNPFPSRKNYFTDILTKIGAGKKINLTYWRGGKELTRNFVLEKAPYDFDSAEKYKDETIGVTIKILTYEVRRFLRLDADYPAVIISNVEEGSKAAIGKIRTFELITKINEQPVSSVQEYKDLIKRLTQDEKQTKLKFAIERKGKGRFVDIDLEEKPKEGEK